MAGFFGMLVAIGIVIVGAFGLENGEALPVAARLGQLAAHSPWFMAGLFTCLVAAVQLVAGIALVTASANLVYDIYKPFFHKGLEDRTAVLYGRIVAGLILLVGLLLAGSAPAALDALGAVALPVSVQLLPALLGLCWIRQITRQAAVVGLVVGIVAAILTEPLGIAIFKFFGLLLPWGRWPWTIHSAGWGLFFNVLAIIAISLITQRRGRGTLANEMHAYLRSHSSQTPRSRALKPAAWSAALAWFFLAVGPGLVMGNVAFGSAGAGLENWTLSMPSLWGWSLIAWATGVLLIWFLAYKLELSTAANLVVARRPELPRMPEYDHGMKADELHRLLWTVIVIGGAITLIAWTFG
jgi:SSS family solute:Na+ symporter